jgi:hypothetical protein
LREANTALCQLLYCLIPLSRSHDQRQSLEIFNSLLNRKSIRIIESHPVWTFSHEKVLWSSDCDANELTCNNWSINQPVMWLFWPTRGKNTASTLAQLYSDQHRTVDKERQTMSWELGMVPAATKQCLPFSVCSKLQNSLWLWMSTSNCFFLRNAAILRSISALLALIWTNVGSSISVWLAGSIICLISLGISSSCVLFESVLSFRSTCVVLKTSTLSLAHSVLNNSRQMSRACAVIFNSTRYLWLPSKFNNIN